MENDFVYVSDISSKVEKTLNYRGIAAAIGFIAGASAGYAMNEPIAPTFCSIFGLYAGIKAAEGIGRYKQKHQNQAFETYCMGRKRFDDNGKPVFLYQSWFELRKSLNPREKKQITKSLKRYYREATKRGREFSAEEIQEFEAL